MGKRIDPRDRMLNFPSKEKLSLDLESVAALRGLPADLKKKIIELTSEHFAKTERPMRDVTQWVWTIVSIAARNVPVEGTDTKSDIHDDIIAVFQKYGPKGTRPD